MMVPTTRLDDFKQKRLKYRQGLVCYSSVRGRKVFELTSKAFISFGRSACIKWIRAWATWVIKFNQLVLMIALIQTHGFSSMNNLIRS